MSSKSEGKEAVNIARGLLEMYQAGFIDGWKWATGRGKNYKLTETSAKMIYLHCEEAFKKRFMKKIKERRQRNEHKMSKM